MAGQLAVVCTLQSRQGTLPWSKTAAADAAAQMEGPGGCGQLAATSAAALSDASWSFASKMAVKTGK